MVCKFCNAEIGENHKFCPECGKRQDEQWLEETPETVKKKKNDAWKLVLLILGFLAAACLLVAVILNTMGVELFPAQDIYRKDVYAVETKQFVKKADTVVATIGDVKLTNEMLQMLYAEEYNAFLSEYYSYITQLGLDLTKPLGQQKSYFNETMTWEQLLLQSSIDGWEGYVQMVQLAQQDGYTLDEEWETALAEMPQNLETQATTQGYDSVEAMLKDLYGETCTMDLYMEYARMIFTGNAYYSSQFEISDAELDAAYALYEQEFADKGITKTSALVSSVRHILIEPEGGTTSEDGKTTTYSDAEWADCLAKAQQVLAEWQSGDADEESFKELVTKYTADTASVSTGGLYEGVMNDGSYMKEFQDWAIDFNRQQGEVGLVKTDYGYHIMYFVEGEAEWIYYTRTKVQDGRYEEIQARLKAFGEATPIKVKYSKIALLDLNSQ